MLDAFILALCAGLDAGIYASTHSPWALGSAVFVGILALARTD